MKKNVFYIVFVALVLVAIVVSLCLSLAVRNKVYDIDDFYKLLKDSGNFEMEVELDGEVLLNIKGDNNKLYMQMLDADPFYLEESGDLLYTYFCNNSIWAKDDGIDIADAEFDIDKDLEGLFKSESYEYSKKDKVYKLKKDAVVGIEDIEMIDLLLTVGKDSCEFVGKANDEYEDITIKIRITNVGKTSVNLPEVGGYLVTFDSNSDVDVAALVAEAGDNLNLRTPTKEGHAFLGWFTDEDLSDAFGCKMPQRNITLYAKWEINNYSVSFDSNNGSYVASISKAFGAKITQPIAPTKPDCDFAGWYSDSGLKNAYVFNTMPARNITLYAKWKPAQWIVTPAAMDVLVGGIEELMSDLRGIDDGAYLSCSIHFALSQGDNDNQSYRINIKGNFDANNLDNNCGYIEIINYRSYAQLLKVFVDADGTVYFSEGITKTPDAPATWLRLSQAQSLDFVREYFSQIPSIISNYCESGGLDALFDTQDLSSPLSMINIFGANLLRLEAPDAYEYYEGFCDGSYVMSLKLDTIVSMMKSPMFADILESSPETAGIYSIIFPMLGMALVEDEGNYSVIQEGALPDISFRFEIMDGKLKSYYLDYTLEDEESYLQLEFGLRDFVIYDYAVPIDYVKPYGFPTDTESDIDDVAIKLTFTVGLPQKTGFEQVLLEIYIQPDFRLIYDEYGDLAVINNVVAYGFATIRGMTAEFSAMYEANTDRLVFDLAGLYQVLGVSIPPGGSLYYYNNFMRDWLAEADIEEDVYDDTNNEIFEELLMMLACIDLATDEGVPGDGNAVVDILLVLQYLSILGLYPQQYLPLSLEPIADNAEIPVEWLEVIIGQFIGIESTQEQSLTDYLIANGLYLEMQSYHAEQCDENGAGFLLTLRTSEEGIAIFGAQIALVPRSEALAAISSLAITHYEGGGRNLADPAEYEHFRGVMNTMLVNFMMQNG